MIVYSEKNWAPTINFFKKKSNWKQIYKQAARAVLPDAIDEAKRLAYSHFRQNTGGLGNSIDGEIDLDEDHVRYEITSDHPAAALIEYGGYSPFPPWTEVGGELSFPQAKAVFKNQPFAEAHPFLRPAANNAVKKLNKQIVAEFNRAKP